MRAVWIATGNNLVFATDMARRSVVCDLDAGDEHPEDRKFACPNLLELIRQQRGELVRAALVLLRAFVVAGRQPHGLAPLGGFEKWDALIRGTLIWAGVGDPDGGRGRIRSDGDADTELPKAALAILHLVFGESAWTTAQVVSEVNGSGCDDDVQTLAAFAKCKSSLTAQALGDALSALRDRPLGGLVLRRAGTTGGKARWVVEVAKAAKVASSISENIQGDDRVGNDSGGEGDLRPPGSPKPPQDPSTHPQGVLL
jgi:hypothetical protein